MRLLLNNLKSGWLSLALIPTLGMAVCSHAPTATEATRVINTSSPSASPETKTYHAVGVVKSLNPKQLVIEIAHEDIEGLMPAMTMAFYVKDKSLLSGLKPGDRIAFTLVNGIGGLKITEIRKR